MKIKSSPQIFLDNGVEITQKHIELLKAVAKTGSITKAAKYTNISYKNAWDTLASLESDPNNPIIVRSGNKTRKSGSKLSEFGDKIVATYEYIDKLQNRFLNNVCENLNPNNVKMLNLEHNNIKLSARNQLYVTISEIKKSALNSAIFAKISSGQEICAFITEISEKSLNLEVGKEVLFIFKAPSVKLSRQILDDKIVGIVKDIRVGTQTAEILVDIGEYQNIVAMLSKNSLMDMRLGVDDKVCVEINPTAIIVGV